MHIHVIWQKRSLESGYRLSLFYWSYFTFYWYHLGYPQARLNKQKLFEAMGLFFDRFSCDSLNCTIQFVVFFAYVCLIKDISLDCIDQMDLPEMSSSQPEKLLGFVDFVSSQTWFLSVTEWVVQFLYIPKFIWTFTRMFYLLLKYYGLEKMKRISPIPTKF